MARGGRNLTNTPKLKGIPAAGSRPSGNSGLVPNGQYPTILKARRMPDVPGAVMNQGGPAINEPGASTINSTPA
jgi:hypothetical protein